jgi:hypothetical protein
MSSQLLYLLYIFLNLLFGSTSHICVVFPELVNIPYNGSDDGNSEENLVAEDDSSVLDQDISDPPSENDFKTEVDISRKVVDQDISDRPSAGRKVSKKIMMLAYGGGYWRMESC